MLSVPGVHRVADRLLGRDRLAGDRRLVDRRGARHDRRRRARCAPPGSRRAGRRPTDLVRRQLDLARRRDARGRRAGVRSHEVADRAPRARERARLEQTAEREQEDDGRALAPLRRCAAAPMTATRHEHVHVERARAQRPTARCAVIQPPTTMATGNAAMARVGRPRRRARARAAQPRARAAAPATRRRDLVAVRLPPARRRRRPAPLGRDELGTVARPRRWRAAMSSVVTQRRVVTHADARDVEVEVGVLDAGDARR